LEETNGATSALFLVRAVRLQMEIAMGCGVIFAAIFNTIGSFLAGAAIGGMVGVALGGSGGAAGGAVLGAIILGVIRLVTLPRDMAKRQRINDFFRRL
jgi:outer membrane lipoprotein SlyB